MFQTSAQIAAHYWGVVAVPISVHDCRSLVKVLVGSAKTTIWGISNSRGFHFFLLMDELCLCFKILCCFLLAIRKFNSVNLRDEVPYSSSNVFLVGWVKIGRNFEFSPQLQMLGVFQKEGGSRLRKRRRCFSVC